MDGVEFDSLVADIKANGQREPIILHDGMILDGGNRYRACIEAGIEPETMKYGGGNIVAYVLSANLHRRHLSGLQAAAIVASCRDWSEVQSHGGKRKGNNKMDQEANLPLETVADRAKASGASIRTQATADRISKKNPALAVALGQGEVKPSDAVEQVTGKRPGSKPNKIKAAQPEPETEAYDPRDDQISDLAETATKLAEENEDLKARLAIEGSPVSDEEKTAAVDLIEELRKENTTLKAMVKALTASRDHFQAECAEHKSQIQRQRREIDKLKKAA